MIELLLGRLSLPDSFWQIDAAGTAGLALAVALACLELKRRSRRLTVHIIGRDILGSIGETQFVVVKIALVNPSSEGKTVGRFQIRRGKYRIATVRAEANPATGLATFAPRPGIRTKTVRQSETTSYPLDVPAHGSIAFFHCLSISPVSVELANAPDSKSRRNEASLEAVDLSERVIAATTFSIPVCDSRMP